MLLNRERAYEVMDRHNLSGLVATAAVNIYYLTDYWETMTDFGWPFLVYAVLPRHPDALPSLVIPSIKLDRQSDTPTWVPNIVAFSDYSGRQAAEEKTGSNQFPDEPPAAPWTGWPVNPGGTLTPIEQSWQRRTNEHADRMAATPAWGLRRALCEAGLTKGRIGSDDPRVLHWMHDMGLPDIEAIDATNVFREIRMVKSPDEVEIMRQAARINEVACLEAATSMRDGITKLELETIFHTALIRQGARGVKLATDLGGFRHGRIVTGDPCYVDGTCRYKRYFADFGRTVAPGQASDLLKRRMKAFQAGWETACETLRPGVKRSALIAKSVAAVQKAGMPEFFYVSPHSIGLEHTDSPQPFGPATHGAESDYVFMENMTINIDMPFTEWGWGGMHMEDTLLVTRNGFEPLTSMKNDLIVNLG